MAQHIFTIQDLKNLLTTGKRKRYCHKSLDGIQWTNEYIALLIIPCLYSKEQARGAQAKTFEIYSKMATGNLLVKNLDDLDIHNIADYPDIITELSKIIDLNPEMIFAYLLAQKQNPGASDALVSSHLAYTWELFKECKSFAGQKIKSINYQEKDGVVDLLDQKEKFLKLCQRNPFKIAALFFDLSQTAWLTEFLRGYQKQELSILPGIKLLLVKIK